MASPRNLEVLALEFALFVLPVLVIFRKPLRRRFASSSFWKV